VVVYFIITKLICIAKHWKIRRRRMKLKNKRTGVIKEVEPITNDHSRQVMEKVKRKEK